MENLVHLTETEIAAVSGGQTINIYSSQSNYSNVNQYAYAYNSGNVTATASGYGSLAAAVGASATNTAMVAQANNISASIG